MNSISIKDKQGNTCWYPINPTGKPDTTKLHRTDGPAYEGANGGKAWYVNNQRHRTDGPACERADGSKAWYLEGKRLTEKEWERESARYRTLIGKLRGK